MARDHVAGWKTHGWKEAADDGSIAFDIGN